MYDGIPGKQHVFAYIKADDGQWYKATNDNKTEVVRAFNDAGTLLIEQQ